MSDEIRNLLAGYATGTLTESERKALFEAALTDEGLFAAIADEQPLRELLEDPALRAELLERILPSAPLTFRERFAAWLRRPGVAAGLVISLAGTRIMEGLLFGVRPQDPATFGVITVIVLAISALACWLPAWRAARMNPMTALRQD